jgi:CDGSH-type Zn-finger protein
MENSNWRNIVENKPNIVKKAGISIKLMPGIYYYCRCGLSKNQPFCDGNHKETTFQPKKFILDEPKELYACLCKHTQNAPYCDGSHKKI